MTQNKVSKSIHKPVTDCCTFSKISEDRSEKAAAVKNAVTRTRCLRGRVQMNDGRLQL